MKKKFILGIFLALVMALAVGCSSGQDQTEGGQAEPGSENQALYRGYQAPHGDQAFARIVVAMDGDTVVDVAMDEFQYFSDDSGAEFVPNTDSGLGQGSTDGVNLGSKLVNDDMYSSMMAEGAGATETYSGNINAIIDFAKGKTLEEIQNFLDESEAGEVIDAVAGATFVDTAGYLQAIVDTVEDGLNVSQAQWSDSSAVELKEVQSVGNSANDFMDIVVAMEADTIVASSIDELYYLEDGEGVPNSDGAFGENYADQNAPLSSKLENDEAYSSMMEEIADASLTYGENIRAIEEFTLNKTADEIESVAEEATPGQPVDSVSGATFVNTVTYLEGIVEATKQ